MNLLRKEIIRRSALHECDWPCQQKDDRCDLRCPPGWTTVPTHFAICRLTELHPFHPARKGSGSLRPFPIYPLYTRTVILSLDKPIADCFLFRPRKRLEKRRKRSHTNVSNTLVTRASIPPAQTAHVCFHTRKRVHTRLCSKNRTQRLTRRNTGRFGWGRYHYPRSVLRGSETLWGRVSERHTLPLLGLGRVCSRRTQRACGTAMRSCASLSRGVAAPLGCVIPLLFLLPH